MTIRERKRGGPTGIALAVLFWCCAYLLFTARAHLTYDHPTILSGMRFTVTGVGAILVGWLLATFDRDWFAPNRIAIRIVSMTILSSLLTWSARCAYAAIFAEPEVTSADNGSWALLWAGYCAAFLSLYVLYRLASTEVTATWPAGLDLPYPRPTRNFGRPPQLASIYTADAPEVVVYLPHSYTGRGPAQSCVKIVSEYAQAGLRPDLHMVRARSVFADTITGREALPRGLRHAPWTMVRQLGLRQIEADLLRRLGRLDPAETLVEFWPDCTARLVAQVKERGFTTVRTMINCACATSRPILEQAYARLDLPAAHGVSLGKAMDEIEELRLYDYILSGNDEVDKSLRAIGIPENRILKTSFGWDPARFEGSLPAEKMPGRLRFLSVGTIEVRKGVPDLIAAWTLAGLEEAELLLVGRMEPGLTSRLTNLPANVRILPFSDDIGGLYRSADVFVFPTLEEGGPQVVYEAAGCGAAVLTTPMGQARLFKHQVNGLIAPPSDPKALAAAMRQLADDPQLLARLRAQGAADAQNFTYEQVGRSRARLLQNVLELRREPRRDLAGTAPLGRVRISA